MVRHERTILNDNIKKNMSCYLVVRIFIKMIAIKNFKKHWKQMKTLRAYKYQDGAINLSKNMPWVLTNNSLQSIGKNKTDENKRVFSTIDN